MIPYYTDEELDEQIKAEEELIKFQEDLAEGNIRLGNIFQEVMDDIAFDTQL